MSNIVLRGGLLFRHQPIRGRRILAGPIFVRRIALHASPYKTIFNRLLRQDVRNGGNGYIAGTGAGIVTINGRPAVRRIICFRRDGFMPVRDTWSKADGTYRLHHLNPDFDYIVMAVDHQKEWEPVAWDWVRPATELPPPAAPGP